MLSSELDTILNRTIQASHEGIALLEVAKAEMEQLIEDTPDVILIFTGSGQILKANKAVQIIQEKDFTLLSDYTLSEVFSKQFSQILLSSAIRSFETKELSQTTTKLIDVSRKGKTYLWSSVCIRRNKKEDSFYLSTGKDISKIIAYQDQLELTLDATKKLAATTNIPEIILTSKHFLDQKMLIEKSSNTEFWFNKSDSYSKWTFLEGHEIPSIKTFEKSKLEQIMEHAVKVEVGAYLEQEHALFIRIESNKSNNNHYLKLNLTSPYRENHDTSVFINTLMQSVGIALDNVLLMTEKEEQARLESAFLALATIQNGLLPPDKNLPGLNVNYLYQPAEKVGGDWLGYHHIEGTSISVAYIADITGHGIPAAVITGTLCGASFSSRIILDTLSDHSEGEFVEKYLNLFAYSLNKVILQTARSEYLASMFVIAIDHEKGQMWYLNAGHNLPLIYQSKKQKVKSLVSSGPQLGLADKHHYTIRKNTCEKGDYILLYTDGLVENTHIDGRAPLHIRDLKKEMLEAKNGTKILSFLSKETESLKQEDDVACLILDIV